MTIAAAYLVSDGVVLGADSSTTVQVTTPQGTGVVQLLNHAQKVFEVGENSRLGICTWGAASIGNISHRTAIARLSEEINKDSTVQDAAEKLVRIVEPEMKKAGIDFIGYYVGGWNPITHEPACYHIEITKDKTILRPLDMGVCMFSGTPRIFTRVFWGVDPQLREDLLREIKNSLPAGTIANFDEIFNKAYEKVSAPLITLGHKDLPIREAIDFVYTYLHITIKASKFSFGAPACGGPIEVGFVSADRTFRWARHKPFFSAIIEQEGDCDVR